MYNNKTLHFTKMQGLGNDYIYVNCLKEEVNDPGEVSKKISDRHFGIGSDGLVLILPGTAETDFTMRMFNSDGSEAEMCGNAIRCVGKFVYDNKLTEKQVIKINTLAGVKILDLTIANGEVTHVRVDMGEPILEPAKIPVSSELSRFISQKVDVEGKEYEMTCVSMGNPHAVTYVNDVINFPLEKVGPKVETHSLFPRKINAEFVEILDRGTLKMRVWERGAGETLACGTGACAVLVATVLNGKCDRKATIKLLGGDLLIEWNETDNHIYMTGPAVKVFEGTINL